MSISIEKIGRYKIISELGRGAMGVVYKGFDPSIERFVAIKTLVANSKDIDLKELEHRFKVEAKAAGRLTHPNIISIYEFGEEKDLAFIAMEFVDGNNLSELQERGTLPDTQTLLQIMQKVLDGLQYAHQQGIVHRDIKPSNIMYSVSNEVKIADFGIARLESSNQTQLGTVIGTPGYMSPEQIIGHQADHRSDLFSAGVLLYELVTGERAFESASHSSTIYKVVHTELPPPSKICPTLPTQLDAVLSKALAKQPADRYQAASEFSDAISGVLQSFRLAKGGDSLTNQTVDKTVIRHKIQESKKNSEKNAFQQVLSTSNDNIAVQIGKSDRPKIKNMQAYVQSESRWNIHWGKVSSLSGGHQGIVGTSLALALGLGIFLVVSNSNNSIDLQKEADAHSTPIDADDISLEGDKETSVLTDVGTIFSDCDSCPDMVVVPPGNFFRGSSNDALEPKLNEGLQKNVSISYTLAVGVVEVTRQQFSAFVEDTGYGNNGCWIYDGNWEKKSNSNWKNPGFVQTDNHPVTCVSWNDAKAYVRWLSKRTGEQYRLLSESEWEYVTRGGTSTARFWGDAIEDACISANVADESSGANYPGWSIHGCNDAFVHTSPVATFQPNLFGLHDTLGNVFEWVEDCWSESYTDSTDDGRAFVDDQCEERVLRGGSWFSRPEFVRSAYRNRFASEHRSSSFGFRIARELVDG